MARINPIRIRRQQARLLKRLERYGYNVFIHALRLQAEQGGNELPIREAYEKFYQFAGVEAAKINYTEISTREPKKAEVPSTFLVNTWRSWMRSYVQNNLGTMITNVSETSRERINQALQTGLEQGLLTVDLRKLILEEVASPARARAIALTEATRATAEGKRVSAQEYFGDEPMYKVWIHSGAANERSDHVAAQGRPVPANEPFQVGNTTMQQPGDLSGGAEQTINCQCTLVFMSERFAKRNY
jgi:hypothetical protein